jgi:hypothetical protein
VAPSRWASLKDAALAVITELAQLKVKVVACVADNAANLQAIANPVAEDDPEHDNPLLNSVRVQMPLMLRCGCRVLQLAFYDLQPLRQAFDLAKTVVEAQKLRVSANETRWNSKCRVMEAACAHLHTLPSTSQSEVSEAMVLLEPFARATDVLQSDSACLRDALGVFESLNRWCATLASRCVTSPLGRARMEGLLRLRESRDRFAKILRQRFFYGDTTNSCRMPSLCVVFSLRLPDSDELTLHSLSSNRDGATHQTRQANNLLGPSGGAAGGPGPHHAGEVCRHLHCGANPAFLRMAGCPRPDVRRFVATAERRDGRRDSPDARRTVILARL